MDAIETIKLCLFCVSLALVLSGTTFIVRECRYFNGISKLTVIRKRYSQITNIVVGLSIFQMLIILTFQGGLILFSERMNESTSNILLICFSALKPVCFHAILYLMFLDFG